MIQTFRNPMANLETSISMVSTNNFSYQLTIYIIHQNSAIELTPQASWWTYNGTLCAEQKRYYSYTQQTSLLSSPHCCVKIPVPTRFYITVTDVMKLWPVLIAYLLWICYRNLWPTSKFVLFTSCHFFSMKWGFFIAQSIHILCIMSKLQLNS